MLNKTHEMLLKDVPQNCVLFFTSKSCHKCLLQYEILEDSNLDNIEIYVIDESSPEIGLEFNVFAVPVMIYIKAGKEIDRSYGTKAVEYIVNKYNEE